MFYTCIRYMRLIGTPVLNFYHMHDGLIAHCEPDPLVAAGGIEAVSEMGRRVGNHTLDHFLPPEDAGGGLGPVWWTDSDMESGNDNEL